MARYAGRRSDWQRSFGQTPSSLAVQLKGRAMSSSDARLNAVIAALEKVRLHLEDLDDHDEIDTATYNRWIGMLDRVVEGNWKSLALADELIPVSEMLMHVDAAIAFLEAHREN
jgi:hypothetical protein